MLKTGGYTFTMEDVEQIYQHYSYTNWTLWQIKERRFQLASINKQITSPATSTEAIQVMPPRLTYRLHRYKELLPVTQQSFHHYQQELNTNEAMFVSVNKLKMSYILRRNEYPSQSG